MRRVLLLPICADLLFSDLRAQKAQDEIACLAERKANAATKEKLWNG